MRSSSISRKWREVTLPFVASSAPIARRPCRKRMSASRRTAESRSARIGRYQQQVIRLAAPTRLSALTVVNWYQVFSPLKLMMDRLVCEAGGNPDPTRTQGKECGAGQADRARRLGLSAAPGRPFVLGRGARRRRGSRERRRSISDRLCFMHLCAAGPAAELDRYIGYRKPYATSHVDLDADAALQEEVRNAARTWLEGARAKLEGKLVTAGENLRPPRQK